ncbi:hypothetical protein YC2023_007242 [Brassica napus]
MTRNLRADPLLWTGNSLWLMILILLHTGFFVCVNSFLSLLTVMPIRVLLTFWDAFKNRQLRRPSSSELSDLACFLVLASGTILLGRTGVVIPWFAYFVTYHYQNGLFCSAHQSDVERDSQTVL